jgi:nitrate/nitrite-specific signal transduction histidine kinase
LAQKVKDLELNQSVLDRYIESLNERYAGALDELGKEIDEIASVVTNSSNALNEAARRMEKSASKCEKETEKQIDRFTKTEHALMSALKEFEKSRVQARRRENLILSFMIIILSGMVWNSRSVFVLAKRKVIRGAHSAEESDEQAPQNNNDNNNNNNIIIRNLSSPDFATVAFRESLYFE